MPITTARPQTADERTDLAGLPRGTDGRVTEERPEPSPSRHRLAALKGDGIACVVLAVVTGIVAWELLWREHALASIDSLTFYLPWYGFLGEQLRSFHIPGWNPHQFSGTPFAGDPQSGWMYVPAMLFFTILPALAAYKAFIIFHLLFAGVTAYALGRVLGMGVVASLMAATVYEFGPYARHLTCCTIQFQLAAWIPLALIGVELALRSPSFGRRLGGWSLTGFAISQMLAGWLGQGAYDGLLVVASYLGFRALISPPASLGGWWRRVRRLIVDGTAVLVIGAGLAAAGLLPRLDVTSRTNVAGGSYQIGVSDDYGWHWDNLAWWTASYQGDFLREYLGGATAALAILAPIMARRRHATPYFAALTVVTMLLPLKPTPLHELFFLLPRFRDLHQHSPERVLAVLWIGPALLAAATIEALPAWHGRWRVPAAALVPLFVLGVLLVALGDRRVMVGPLTIGAFVAVSLLIAAMEYVNDALLRRRTPLLRQVARLVPVLLLLSVWWDPTGYAVAKSIVDPSSVYLSTIPPTGDAAVAIAVNGATTDPGGAGEFLRQRAGDWLLVRFFGYNEPILHGGEHDAFSYRQLYDDPEIQALLVNARAMRLGLYDVQGYNPVQLSRYSQFIQALNGNKGQNYHDAQVLRDGVASPLLNLLNARYIVIPNKTPPGRPRLDLLDLAARHREVFRNERIRVLENDDALPRAWIVHRARTAESRTVLKLLRSGSVDPRQTALLETDAPVLALPANPTFDSVTITAYEPDAIELTARSDAAGLVILSEAYDPGWHAYVDGKAVPLYVADGVLRGVPVPAGAHTVEVRFEPPSLRRGLAVTIATTLVLAVGLGAGLWRRGRPHRARLLYSRSAAVSEASRRHTIRRGCSP